MWRCPHCGEMIEEAFDSCWKCGTGKEGAPPDDPQAYQENPAPTGVAVETPCPICSATSFSWGKLGGSSALIYEPADASLIAKALTIGGDYVDVRCCHACGNLQLFAQEFVQRPPQV